MKREKKQKEKLLEETTGQCIYCGHPLSLDSMEIDHIIPLSAGGGNEYGNKVCSCPRCNARKADKTLQEFLEEMPESKLFRYWNRVDALLEQGKLGCDKWMLLTKIDPAPRTGRLWYDILAGWGTLADILLYPERKSIELWQKRRKRILNPMNLKPKSSSLKGNWKIRRPIIFALWQNSTLSAVVRPRKS